jgi:N-acetylglucosaminyldiphosphoundecaprenol N-acetyl-beta-D-mannosaminyltransferase
MHQTKILDIKIDKITTKEVLEKIKGFLLSDSQRFIITLNPEMVVEAQKNDYFKKIINEANIVIPDGTGILLACKYIYKNKLPGKITGIDLIYKICESEFIRNKKIYLLGAGKGIAEETAEVLSRKYSYLNIVGAEEGIAAEIFNEQFSIFPPEANQPWADNKLPMNNEQLPTTFDNTGYDKLNNILIQRINNAKPDILFVAFGAPKQEIWIYENLKKMPSVKLTIGVGGSFDFISGKIKRAPFIFQRLGLEWLWRLILEPSRIKRIYNATVKFGWMVWRNK